MNKEFISKSYTDQHPVRSIAESAFTVACSKEVFLSIFVEYTTYFGFLKMVNIEYCVCYCSFVFFYRAIIHWYCEKIR